MEIRLAGLDSSQIKRKRSEGVRRRKKNACGKGDKICALGMKS